MTEEEREYQEGDRWYDVNSGKSYVFKGGKWLRVMVTEHEKCLHCGQDLPQHEYLAEVDYETN